MNSIKKKMIDEAQRKYRKIFPCTFRRNLDDCFTVEGNTVIFWFNTEDYTTHILTSRVE